MLRIGKSNSKFKLSTFKEKLEAHQEKIVQVSSINKTHLNCQTKIKNKMIKILIEPALLIFRTD